MSFNSIPVLCFSFFFLLLFVAQRVKYIHGTCFQLQIYRNDDKIHGRCMYTAYAPWECIGADWRGYCLCPSALILSAKHVARTSKMLPSLGPTLPSPPSSETSPALLTRFRTLIAYSPIAKRPTSDLFSLFPARVYLPPVHILRLRGDKAEQYT